MRVFRSRRAPAVSPDAVAAVLTAAGFPASELDDNRYRPATEGFLAYALPVPEPDLVAVSWNASPFDYDDVFAVKIEALTKCAAALEAAGYQAELVTEAVSTYYLVVHAEGDPRWPA